MKLTANNTNSYPWDIPFNQRYSDFVNSNKPHKVIYIKEVADTTSFRYRVYNMCQSLLLSDSWYASFFFEDELDRIEELVPKTNIFIFARTRWSIKFNNFIYKLKKFQKISIFDTDDLVCDINIIPTLTNTLDVSLDNEDNYKYWFSYVGGLNLTATLCDASISTNEFLGNMLEKILKKKNYCINNFLDNEQIAISEKYFKVKDQPKNFTDDFPFKMGYFSGTPTHINDFKLIAPEIRDLLKKYSNFELHVIGFMDFPEYLSEFGSRIIRSPLVDFLTLQEKMSEVDVNLVPLVENDFTNCKSELKFFEGSVVGTLTCASPTFTFKQNINNGKTGFLCKAGEWFKLIEDVYLNKYNTKEIINNARDYCLKKYSPQGQLKTIEETFSKILQETKPSTT